MLRLLAPALLLATPALAQTEPPPDDLGDPGKIAAQLDPADLSRDRITVAIGAATVPSYEGSDTNRIVPGVAVQGSVQGYSFATRGTYLSVDAIRDRPGPVWDVELGPVVGLNFDRARRRSIDDARVEALGDKKLGLDLGGYVGVGKTGVLTSLYDKLSASLTYVRNVNGASDGGVWTPRIDYGTPLSPKAYAGLSASADYASGKYADYYFSVTNAGFLASGLPQFTARKGWKSWSLNGYAAYALTGDLLHGLGLVAGGGYSRLVDDAARSPVVAIAGDRDQWTGTVGLSYTF